MSRPDHRPIHPAAEPIRDALLDDRGHLSCPSCGIELGPLPPRGRPRFTHPHCPDCHKRMRIPEVA